ncbi:MAG TPA: M14 family zinc carboxypeptidase, partial [Parasegetibacter sp.]
ALTTAFALLDDKNTKYREWLKNTLIIIDPCLNPDGRERYVQWYNSVKGANSNPVPFSREHSEPWPGGRSNHYYFDLNRDWAWQTQTESRQRMTKYNEWLPHIHVDFHEQGYNDPYYFAPAAEPLHEVITPWQREFQMVIGKNNARYFDEKGWLYFTRELFDLFYPSYGDTYPMFNGAIGMTYEQAGHSRAGLAVITDAGDTLTLADRILHHQTTGLSTIEVAASNAEKINQEFEKFFNLASTKGFGEYKTYVIKYDDSRAQQINQLKKLLHNNKITFGYGSGTSARGFNYFTGKEETFSIGERDLIISSLQPKSALVQVLMEPNSRLTDSVTYDITAWALPYAYGLQSYATREIISTQKRTPPPNTGATIVKGAYAYAVKWNGLNAAEFLAQLLQKGIKVRVVHEPFTINQQDFGRGSLVITRASNQQAGDLSSIIADLAGKTGVEVFSLSSGFAEKGLDLGSEKVKLIKNPHVVLVTGRGISSLSIGEIWHFFDKELRYPITLVNSDDINQVDWSAVDVLILPDGRYSFLDPKSPVSDKIKQWVTAGGKLIALEGAVAQLASAEWGIKHKKESEEKKGEEEKANPYAHLKNYAQRERDNII